MRENLFVTISKDKNIKVWDSNSRSQISAIMSDKTKEENLNLAMSPDGNFLGVSNVKDELSFFDMRMWKQHKQIKYKVDINGF